MWVLKISGGFGKGFNAVLVEINYVFTQITLTITFQNSLKINMNNYNYSVSFMKTTSRGFIYYLVNICIRLSNTCGVLCFPTKSMKIKHIFPTRICARQKLIYSHQHFLYKNMN